MSKKQSPFKFYPLATNTEPSVSIVEGFIHAGFPSPVDDAYLEPPIDLNKELIKHPATTYIVRVTGDSMIDEGIEDGDLLVVDKSKMPEKQSLSVCMYKGEFALKRIVQVEGGGLLLMSGNPKYKPIVVEDSEDLGVFGVVTWVMKKKS